MSEQGKTSFVKDFFDKYRDDEEMQRLTTSTIVVFISKDYPEFSRSSVELASTLPLGMVTFIEASRSKGSEKYDTFTIKEPPIKIE
jgi:hypothetical protein